MATLQKAALMILVLCLCVGCDQATKAVARNHLATPQPIYLLGDVLVFQHTENTGAFLSLGARLPEAVRFWLLIVFVGAVLIGMARFIWISTEMSSMGVIGGSLIIGGGLSNLIDRIVNDGSVHDFVNLGVGNLRTGVFNVADLAIVVGAGLLLISSVFLVSPERGLT